MQQSDRSMLAVVILIVNNCMVPIFTHIGRMARDYEKDTSVRQLVICLLGKVAKKADTTPTKMRKLKVIKEKAQGGNLLAQEYLEKLKKGKVSTDWAYKVLVNSMREQRMLKMIAVAEQRHLNHNNPDELIEFIASEMRNQGLDPTNEENFDSYLNFRIR